MFLVLKNRCKMNKKAAAFFSIPKNKTFA